MWSSSYIAWQFSRTFDLFNLAACSCDLNGSVISDLGSAIWRVCLPLSFLRQPGRRTCIGMRRLRILVLAQVHPSVSQAVCCNSSRRCSRRAPPTCSCRHIEWLSCHSPCIGVRSSSLGRRNLGSFRLWGKTHRWRAGSICHLSKSSSLDEHSDAGSWFTTSLFDFSRLLCRQAGHLTRLLPSAARL